jgi:DNA-binding protein H-NS
MARIDLTKLTYAQLLDLSERVDIAIVERKAEKAKSVKEQLEALAQESGFSLSDLVGGKKQRGRKAAVAVKYRNPKDASQTWSGRGRKPNWLVAAVKKGAKIESFAV